MTEPTPEHIMQVGLGFWASKTLLSAVEMGVFTSLAGQPKDTETLRKDLGLHERSARDFFDTLVALGFLARKVGVYSNTPEADLFLDEKKPSYIGGLLAMASGRLYKSWGQLTTALQSGKSVSGNDTFDALYETPEKMREFLTAMTGISLPAAKAIAAKFPWANYKTFADAGCAQGATTVQVALANPHLQGIGYDLEIVRPVFEEYAQSFGLSDRLKFAPGDFFKEDLPKVDAIIMGHILHDWNLDEKKLLVRKAFDSLPKGGALIVYEALIDDAREKNAFGLMMSLNMLIETPGGFDYTGADCQGWMREAGFTETRVEHLHGPDGMVVGIK